MFMPRKKIVLVLNVLALCASWACAYHVDKKIAVPGDGGWDYLTRMFLVEGSTYRTARKSM